MPLVLLRASPVYTLTQHRLPLPFSSFASSLRPAAHCLIDIHLRRALTLPNTQLSDRQLIMLTAI